MGVAGCLFPVLFFCCIIYTVSILLRCDCLSFHLLYHSFVTSRGLHVSSLDRHSLSAGQPYALISEVRVRCRIAISEGSKSPPCRQLTHLREDTATAFLDWFEDLKASDSACAIHLLSATRCRVRYLVLSTTCFSHP